MTIDLNCDMGEGMPNDAAIMPYISSANIACGYHAGDEATIRATIDLCLTYGVAIGAHPGFNDKKNFGRVPVQLTADELYQLVWKQLEIMETICKERRVKLHHVKPHGALYNMAARDKAMSNTIAQAVKDFNPDLVYYGLSGSVMVSEARVLGLKTMHEVFADRTYQADGTLTPRSQAKALIEMSEDAINQILQMLMENSVKAINGGVIPIKADTICIHGDGKHPVEFARQLNNLLKMKGFKILPP
ncbi:MAG TPA: 5-oxoprolinase subunit PxpA [Cyclobacteriaceae bacterium]|nr:5-oxoprolinase subunit PxpA [Cyclobacteriaceae bacterium]HRJ82558.1 5-oxoprolinase subunit PxpA [Cyclobacteriaceae bacterium]